MRCLLDPLEQVLRETFGLSAFRPHQEAAIRAVAAGRDLLAILPTGGGKSLLYQLPAALRFRAGLGPTLVVSPLVALMDDQVRGLRARGLPAVALHASQAADERRSALQAAAAAALVYASPEWLARPSGRRWVAKVRPGLVAVDEAHCVAEWGHDFRPEYLQLAELRQLTEATWVAVTATATPRCAAEIVSSLGLRDPWQARAPLWRPELRLSVELIGGKRRVERVLSWVEQTLAAPGRVVVYAATRAQVTALATALRKKGLETAHYHAGRTEGARQQAASAFALGKRRVLVATTAFGMGVDLPDVRAVLHAAAPTSLEAYAQQVGRAGRDGASSHGVLLWSDEDRVVLQRLLEGASPGTLAGFEALEAYAYGRSCRWQALGRWMGDEGPACGACDACARPAEVAAALAAAQGQRAERATRRRASAAAAAERVLDEQERTTLLRFIEALPRPASRTLLASALRGGRSRLVLRRKLDGLAGFGALRGVPAEAILRAIDELLAAGQLIRRGKKYPTVAAPGAKPRTPRAPRATGLLARLIRWRRAEARRRKWKLYQVLPNVSLEALVARRPTSLEALEALPGLGPVRVERWGHDLLRLVAEAEPPAE